jgi:hypothetical protein
MSMKSTARFGLTTLSIPADAHPRIYLKKNAQQS